MRVMNQAIYSILCDLEDRAGIEDELSNVNEDIRREIEEAMAKIIEDAYEDR